MKHIDLASPLDLIEIRRQLVTLRSQYSDNERVTTEINRLIGKLAHLRKPQSRIHERELSSTIGKTLHRVEMLLSRRSGQGN